MNTELEVLLLELRDAQTRQADVLQDREAVCLNATPEDVRKTLEHIEDEFAPIIANAGQSVSDLEFRVRTCVLMMKEGGRAGGIEATYTGGRVTWDTKGLDKAVKLIPALADYRKTGEPYCTIRKVKDEA